MADLLSLKQQHSETIYRHFFPQWHNGKNIKCFAHDDKNPSLSIYQKNGEYKHHCHACGVSGDCLDLIGAIESISEAGHRIGRLKEIADITESRKKIVKTYDYTDAEGNLVFQVVRYEPKSFFQRRPDPDNKGKWIWNLQGVELVPYNLPQILKSPYAMLVEGERDVESLKELGFVASCNAQGAGKWKESYNSYFGGKRVYILSDNDKPGKEHSLQVAKSLKGEAEIVKVVELPGLPEKGDITDWINQRRAEGKTADQIKTELKEIVKAATEWTEPQEPDLLSSLMRWNDILSLDVHTEYLLDNLIPKGSITLLFGRGGIGKTSLCLQICRAIAEGLPYGDLNTIKTPTYYIDFENPLSVLKQRAESIGKADNLYVWHLSGNPQPPRLDTKDWILYKQLPAGLLIFDTLRASHLADENDSQDMAIIISRLKELREAGFTVLLLHHTPKGNEGIYKGSTAILDLCDHVLGLEGIKEDGTIEFDRENLFRFGVRIKTRYEPHHIFLKFNPNMKGFEVAKDPDNEIMEIMNDILSEAGKALNQSEFVKVVREKADTPKSKTEKLIKKGIGIYWDEVKEAGKRSLLYTPKPISQFPNPIYSQEIRKYSSSNDTHLGNSDTVNSNQSLDNTAFPNFLNTHSGNQEIDRCISCMLTPSMRLLCEVKRPCPRGVVV
jgi:5S rRNA maturation endonuclease (ribonuclease M5)/archaellum biogenesis ATPase FlaH